MQFNKKGLIVFIIFSLILGLTNVSGFTILECPGDGTCCDDDGDGYGVLGQASCTHPGENDCDDDNINVNPASTEVCDVVDNDCDLIVDEDCSDTSLVIGPGNSDLVYYSNDGASTWTASATAISGTDGFFNLFETSDGTVYAGSSGRGFLYTYENGNFNFVYEFRDFFNKDTYVTHILETKDQTLIVVASYDDGIDSGGETFYSIAGNDKTAQAGWTEGTADATIGETINALAYGNIGGSDLLVLGIGAPTGTAIYYSEDLGLTWQTSDLENRNIASLYFDEDNNRFLAGTTDNLGDARIYWSEDGSSWYNTGISGNFAGSFRDFDKNSKGGLFVVGYVATYGTSAIYRSIDGGLSWSDYGYFLDENMLYTIEITEDDSIYIAGFNGAVYKSLDDGSTWNKISEPTTEIILDLTEITGGAALTCVDSDGDSYGINGASDCSMPNEIDCDDTDLNVNPGETEVCNDGIDNDCDVGTDDACSCTDSDGDGYYTNCNPIDCDDSDVGLTETCPCTLTLAEWQDEWGYLLTESGEDYDVYLYTEGTGCDGETVTIEIFDENGVSLGSVLDTVSSGSSVVTWDTGLQGLGTYYFTATIDTEFVTSDDLEVLDCFNDADCDGILDDDDQYDAPSDNVDNDGVPSDADSCWEEWSCSSWSSCENNIQTRTCTAPSLPAECTNAASPTEEIECLVEQPFPVFDWINIVLVLFLLAGYYAYKKD